MNWLWPLSKSSTRALPIRGDVGSYGCIRKHDVHTGVDLYCDPGTVVVAVEAGTVVGVEQFTGAAADSPWWLDSWAVLVEGVSGVVAYGELSRHNLPSVGDAVARGQSLGEVTSVLTPKADRPTTMLHLELYQTGARTTVWWPLGTAKPSSLLNPTSRLSDALTSSSC